MQINLNKRPYLVGFLFGLLSIVIYVLLSIFAQWLFFTFLSAQLGQQFGMATLLYVAVITAGGTVILTPLLTFVFTRSWRSTGVAAVTAISVVSLVIFVLNPMANQKRVEQDFPGYENIQKQQERLKDTVAIDVLSVKDKEDAYEANISLKAQDGTPVGDKFTLRTSFQPAGSGSVSKEKEITLENENTQVTITLRKPKKRSVGSVGNDEIRISLFKEIEWETELGDTAQLDVVKARFKKESGSWVKQEEFNPPITPDKQPESFAGELHKLTDANVSWKELSKDSVSVTGTATSQGEASGTYKLIVDIDIDRGFAVRKEKEVEIEGNTHKTTFKTENMMPVLEDMMKDQLLRTDVRVGVDILSDATLKLIPVSNEQRSSAALRSGIKVSLPKIVFWWDNGEISEVETVKNRY